jgi:hypothetical protein
MHKSHLIISCVFYLRVILTSGIFLFLTNGSASGQKILTDTIYVNFHADKFIPLNNLSVVDAVDKRNEDPRFVRYGSKRKFLLIPVDQEIYLHQPLATEILQGIPGDSTADNIFELELDKFVIEKERGRFSSSLNLVADIPVYEIIGDTAVWRGTLFYDYVYVPKAKKEGQVHSTENLLEKWHADFKLDLLSLRSADGIGNPMHSNLVIDPKIKSLYLNTGIAAFYGYNWWGLQGEVYFSRPESDSRNHYMGGIIRYQNNPDYETFAFGRRAEHFFFRRNEKWVFDIDLNFLLGFCKWKNVDVEEPTLYQIFDFELSSTQSFIYNPLNEKGITLRLGIVENLSYVIGKMPKFQVGGLVGIGVKL